MKMKAESLVREYQEEHRVPCVTLRPTCIWGPFSPNWTVSAVELIQREVPFLPMEGKGDANTVYIDNLVDAVYLALTQDGVVGQTFLINDDNPKTWGELYGGYARSLGVSLRFAEETSGSWELLKVSTYNAGLILRSLLLGKSRPGIRTLREIYNHVPLTKVVVSIFPDRGRNLLKTYAADREKVQEASGPPVKSNSDFLTYNYIARPTQELYGSPSRYSSEKAKRLLGWHPRIPFDEAMSRTCQWLGYAGYRTRAESRAV